MALSIEQFAKSLTDDQRIKSQEVASYVHDTVSRIADGDPTLTEQEIHQFLDYTLMGAIFDRVLTP